MLGIYLATRKDPNITDPQKAQLEDPMGKHLRNAEGRLTTEQVLAIAPMVAYCHVVRTKKKGFINMLIREGPGKEVMTILAAAFDKLGKRQSDASVPRPIFKEIKDALGKARGKGKVRARAKAVRRAVRAARELLVVSVATVPVATVSTGLADRPRQGGSGVVLAVIVEAEPTASISVPLLQLLSGKKVGRSA